MRRVGCYLLLQEWDGWLNIDSIYRVWIKRMNHGGEMVASEFIIFSEVAAGKTQR